MEENQRNFITAIVLSALVLLGWQVFYAGPKLEQEKARQEKIAKLEKLKDKNAPSVSNTAQPTPQAAPTNPQAGTTPQATSPTIGLPQNANVARDTMLKVNPRLPIDTPRLKGSINLKGGSVDDIILKKYNKEIAKNSGKIAVFSPVGSEKPYYAEYGWSVGGGTQIKLPNKETIWKQVGSGTLTPSTPVTIEFDNGAGLIFRRTFSIDDKFLISVKQEVENGSGKSVSLAPYALLNRRGAVETSGIYISHEGLVGVIGEEGLQEISYSDAVEDGEAHWSGKQGWIGITDKYWASALIPDQSLTFKTRFLGGNPAGTNFFQVDYILPNFTIQPGKKASIDSKLFVGAKEVKVIDKYAEQLGVSSFDLLIDWGWFYFITKPMFYALDFFFKMVGNFGVSILIVTIMIKLLLFPLANKSYASMAKMKALQPEMMKIKERFEDDKARQQQAMMELYKKEKINPMSGCWPVLVQIPIFFALYKVLYVTIEMRHAPFFGWIQDLSAPDPTSIFNLFGLIPLDLPQFLMIGAWPLIMGITMWVQMKLNPAPTDPIQAQIFTYMPIFFTFILAGFSAGLVIYWAWNNLLSIIQQYTIMRRQGVEVTLLENMGLKKKLADKPKSS